MRAGELNSLSGIKVQTTTTDSPVLRTRENNVVANSPDEQEINPLKLEDEICITLQSLKKSQEAEYRQAEEKLHAQKTHLISLQEKLQHEKSQLAALSPLADTSANLNIVKNQTEQIRSELKKLKEMQEFYKLFRKAPWTLIDYWEKDVQNTIVLDRDPIFPSYIIGFNVTKMGFT